MRCRRLVKFNNRQNVVWFGSYGLNSDGTAKFVNENDKHDNFGDKQVAVADSLTQRLSIIQQELWYAVNYGLPLLGNITSKLVIDSQVADIILAHPDVVNLKKIESNKIGHTYSATIFVTSTFGEIEINI